MAAPEKISQPSPNATLRFAVRTTAMGDKHDASRSSLSDWRSRAGDPSHDRVGRDRLLFPISRETCNLRPVRNRERIPIYRVVVVMLDGGDSSFPYQSIARVFCKLAHGSKPFALGHLPLSGRISSLPASLLDIRAHTWNARSVGVIRPRHTIPLISDGKSTGLRVYTRDPRL